MNFSSMGPSHGLQFFTTCSSIGLFHRVQSFRNRLLQYGFSTVTGPARNLLQNQFCITSQPPLGIHLLWHGVLHGLQVEVCSTLDLHGLQRDTNASSC